MNIKHLLTLEKNESGKWVTNRYWIATSKKGPRALVTELEAISLAKEFGVDIVHVDTRCGKLEGFADSINDLPSREEYRKSKEERSQ